MEKSQFGNSNMQCLTQNFSGIENYKNKKFVFTKREKYRKFNLKIGFFKIKFSRIYQVRFSMLYIGFSMLIF